MAGLGQAGPTLIFDSGNALFPFEGPQDVSTQPRAKFILETMGKLGTKVMAAGAKDLNFGAAWLKAAAAPTGVQVLSANLLENGKKVFDGSTVITAGGVKVGFIGVSAPGTVGTTKMEATPVLPAVREELAKLKGKADLIVLLAPLGQSDVFPLSTELKKDVDFIAVSSESRGNVPAQRTDGAWVLNPGARGQAIASLALKVDGKGAWVDLAEIAREKEILRSLDARLAEFEPRLKATTDPESKKMIQQTITELKQRRAEQKKKADVAVGAEARTFDYTYVLLNDSVTDDPPLKTEVLKYEPTYAGAH